MITKIDYTSKKDDNKFYESRKKKKSPEKSLWFVVQNFQ